MKSFLPILVVAFLVLRSRFQPRAAGFGLLRKRQSKR